MIMRYKFCGFFFCSDSKALGNSCMGNNKQQNVLVILYTHTRIMTFPIKF